MTNELLWAKGLPLDQVIHRFTVGHDPELDLELVPYDLQGSAAHARMLASVGLLPEADLARVLAGLAQLQASYAAGHFTISTEQEDCHTAIEQGLTERAGEAGKSIHLGRSRNDQVLLALRLYMRDQVLSLAEATVELAERFLDFARANQARPLPGYTHLRRAMPSTFGIWGASFAEALCEELEALRGVYDRLDRCPLGSGAGFGVPLEIDRELVARLLGFSRVQRSVADVQNSRGRHELALTGWISGVGNVLEKFFWDLALYSTEEFGFISLPDAFTTGSSIMPQKRNPDVVELLRGRCASLRTLRTAVENIQTGLPSNYHRDYQLLKEPLFQAVSQGHELLAITAHLVPALRVEQAISQAASGGVLFATQEAYRRVTVGDATFRDAYREVGREVLAGIFIPPDRPEPVRHSGGADNLGLEYTAVELEQHTQWARSERTRLDQAELLIQEYLSG